MKKIILSTIAISAILLLSGCEGAKDTEPDTEVIVSLNNISSTDISNFHYDEVAVTCLIPVATYDSNYYDSYRFDDDLIGNPAYFDRTLNWVDIRTQTVYNIMTDRIDKAKQINCDSILFEDIDIWNRSTFGINTEDAYQYYSSLVEEVTYRGMDVGAYEVDFILRNDIYYLFDFIVD